MAFSRQLTLSAARENMWRLVLIRTIVLTAQLAGVLFVWGYLEADLPYDRLLTILAVLALLSLLTLLRLRRAWRVTDAEYFIQLLLDVAGLTLLLYFAGGSTNPFISYYLVILTICAATLPWRYTLAMTVLSFCLYSLLLFYYHPLQPAAMHIGTDQGGFFGLHVLGMWLTFLISALLIAFFVVKMAQAIRQQDADLAERREMAHQDEQLLAVATLAAGTAHELGTPLSTIAVLLGEMRRDAGDNSALQQDLEMLEIQVKACKQSLHKLVEKFSVDAQGQRVAVPADAYFQEVLERWRLMRPAVRDRVRLPEQRQAPQLWVDETLSQAIMNLLNNAADASPEQIDIALDWDAHTVRLSICDYGSGIPAELSEKLGRPLISSKRRGLGLGLFLSHATVRRFQGRLSLYDHEAGGTLTELQLPVAGSGEA